MFFTFNFFLTNVFYFQHYERVAESLFPCEEEFGVEWCTGVENNDDNPNILHQDENKSYQDKEIKKAIKYSEVGSAILHELEQLPVTATKDEKEKLIEKYLNIFEQDLKANMTGREVNYLNAYNPSKLLSVTDSLDLITTPRRSLQESLLLSSYEYKPNKEKEDAFESSENDKISEKILSKPIKYLTLTNEEYLRSMKRMPLYMQTPKSHKLTSIWNYKTTTEEEWLDLLKLIDEKNKKKENNTPVAGSADDTLTKKLKPILRSNDIEPKITKCRLDVRALFEMIEQDRDISVFLNE